MAQMQTRSVPIVELRGVSKTFGKLSVLHKLDLEVQSGEILALLGPSGCGKSTTLNIIAGFFAPDEGQVLLDGMPLDHVPIYKRNLGMVFQNYSLFPHYTVYDNIAFGLSIRNKSNDEIRNRVTWALSLVRLPDLGDRFPSQLSGGQQQRVAVARALVVEPRVLLLDEPLSNLDARLRKEMQVELKRIQDDTGITMIYVTHDQEEAITLANRIALMRAGAVEQLDAPTNVFEYPKTRNSAHFMGFSNFMRGEIVDHKTGELQVRLASGDVIAVATEEVDIPGNVTVAIREERVIVEAGIECGSTVPLEELHERIGSMETNRLVGRIEQYAYAGNSYLVFIGCAGGLQLRARVPIQQSPVAHVTPGAAVRVHLPREDVRILRDV
jgi:putative spermidine/putrescine transport system ATP-binding protein